jgi:hypothetical protein
MHGVSALHKNSPIHPIIGNNEGESNTVTILTYLGGDLWHQVGQQSHTVGQDAIAFALMVLAPWWSEVSDQIPHLPPQELDQAA